MGDAAKVGKRKWRIVSSRLASNNVYSVLCPEKLGNKLNFCKDTERVRDMQCTLRPLREVWMKVGLEKLENHEGVQNEKNEEPSTSQKYRWNSKCRRSDNAPS